MASNGEQPRPDQPTRRKDGDDGDKNKPRPSHGGGAPATEKDSPSAAKKTADCDGAPSAEGSESNQPSKGGGAVPLSATAPAEPTAPNSGSPVADKAKLESSCSQKDEPQDNPRPTNDESAASADKSNQDSVSKNNGNFSVAASGNGGNAAANKNENDSNSDSQPLPAANNENSTNDESNSSQEQQSIIHDPRGKSFLRISSTGDSEKEKLAGEIKSPKPSEGFHPKRPRRQSQYGSDSAPNPRMTYRQSSQSSGDSPPKKQNESPLTWMRSNNPPSGPSKDSFSKRCQSSQSFGDSPSEKQTESPLTKQRGKPKKQRQRKQATLPLGSYEPLPLPPKSTAARTSRQSDKSSPIITPEQYHLRFCLPRKRKQLAAHKKQFFMNMDTFGGGQSMPISTAGGSDKGGRIPGIGQQRSRDDSMVKSPNENSVRSSMRMRTDSAAGGNSGVTTEMRQEMIKQMMSKRIPGIGHHRSRDDSMVESPNENSIRSSMRSDSAPGSGGVTMEMRMEMMKQKMLNQLISSGSRRSNHPTPNSNRPALNSNPTPNSNNSNRNRLNSGSGNNPLNQRPNNFPLIPFQEACQGALRNSSFEEQQMMFMNAAGKDQGGHPTPNSNRPALNNSNPTPNSNNSHRNRSNSGSGNNPPNQRPNNFPSIPFQEVRQDAQRNSSLEEQQMMFRHNNGPMVNETRGMFMNAARKEQRGGQGNTNGPMAEREGLLMGERGMEGSGYPDNSRGWSGNNLTTQMVTTGVPLRGSSIGGGNGSRGPVVDNMPDVRRPPSAGWSDDGMSLGCSSLGGLLDDSPDPLRPAMTKENFFSKMPGMSPLDVGRANLREQMMNNNPNLWEQMNNNPNLREQMMNNNPDLRERMVMMNMMNGGMMGVAGSMGGGGGMETQQMGSMRNTPVTSFRPTLGDTDRGGGNSYAGNNNNNAAANSLLGKQNYPMDQLSMTGGAGGSSIMGDMIPRSPMPKKSFLQRERIMDAEMRNHMKDALAGFKTYHRRASPGPGVGGGGGGRPSLGGGAGGGHDALNRLSNPPFHPNSSMTTPHETPMESNERNMMMSHSSNIGRAGTMAGNIQHVKLPSLTSPDEGMADNITANIMTVNLAMNGVKVMTSDAKNRNSSAKPSKKSSKQASKKLKQKPDEVGMNRANRDTESSGDSKKMKKLKALEKKKAQEALTASILAATVMPDKPKRPFSAYNLFFQMEREFIKHEISEGRKPMEDPMIKDAMRRVAESETGVSSGDKGGVVESLTDKKKGFDDDKPATSNCTASTKEQLNPQLQNNPSSENFSDPNIPSRYAHLRLDKLWYSVGHKQKRKHRKTQGSCGFIELTKMVSARWKVIDKTDPHVKRYCQNLADLELDSYKKEMDEYKRLVKMAQLEAKTKARMEATTKSTVAEEMDRTGEIMEQVRKLGKKRKQPSLSSLPPSLDKAKEEETAVGRKKKRPKKVRAKISAAAQEGRSSTPTEEQLKPQNTDYDMGRLTDFARMSGPFPGALDTPRGDDFWSGACGDVGDGRMLPPSGGGGHLSGLPPMPFASDGRSMNDARMAAESRRAKEAHQLAVKEAQMAEARMAEARMAAVVARATEDQARMKEAELVRKAEARNVAANSDIQQKFVALAEAEARHRMQMEIQGGMLSRNMGGNNMGGGQQQQDRHGFGMPRDSGGVSGMPRMPQDAAGGPGGPSDFFSPYNPKPAFMGQGNFPPGGTAGASDLSSPLRRKFMEQFGGSSMPGGMPRGLPGAIMPPPPPPSTAGAAAQEDQFDMEVERFLSSLGREIKDKHRRNLIGGAAPASGGVAGAAVAASFGGNFGAEGMEMEDAQEIKEKQRRNLMGSAAATPVSSGMEGAAVAAGLGGNFGAEGMGMGGAGMGMGAAAAAGFPNQMMKGMPMGMRSEMMADMMMRNGRGGNSNHNAHQPNPEMMAKMMMMRNSGGNSNNNVSQPNPEMMAKMMMMRNSGGISNNNVSQLNPEMMAKMMMMRNSGGNSNNNVSQPNPEMMAEMMLMRNGRGGNSNNHANQTNPEMMAEMMMMRNSGGGGHAANNNFSMMPRSPFDGNDFRQHQQGVVLGDGGPGVVGDDVGGGDDDNPALPEYGWGQDSPN